MNILTLTSAEIVAAAAVALIFDFAKFMNNALAV